jgi:hypothetical protein
MMNEIVHIRQVLKHAEGLGWIPFVPQALETPYMTQTKRGHRAWFSPDEYKQLYQRPPVGASPKGKRPGWKSQYEDMHDFVMMMANTGLRPDEFMRLEFRDVKIEDDYATKETILVIDVRGKVGVGYLQEHAGRRPSLQTNLRNRREAEQKAPDEVGSQTEQSRRLLPKTRLLPASTATCSTKSLKKKISNSTAKASAAPPTAFATPISVHAAHGGREHPPDRQQLPHQRPDDRGILRRPHQGPAGRRRHQRHAAQGGSANSRKSAQGLQKRAAGEAPLIFNSWLSTLPAIHTCHAGVAELVDALGLGPNASRHGGSSPSARTTVYIRRAVESRNRLTARRPKGRTERRGPLAG